MNDLCSDEEEELNTEPTTVDDDTVTMSNDEDRIVENEIDVDQIPIKSDAVEKQLTSSVILILFVLFRL